MLLWVSIITVLLCTGISWHILTRWELPTVPGECARLFFLTSKSLEVEYLVSSLLPYAAVCRFSDACDELSFLFQSMSTVCGPSIHHPEARKSLS
jgi:hypothetical protein